MPDELPTTMHVPLRGAMPEGNDAEAWKATAAPIATSTGGPNWAVVRATTSPHHRGMRGAALAMTLCALASGSLARAQARTPEPPTLGAPIDGVIATVNDSAILASTLRMIAVGKIRSRMAEFGALSNGDREAIFRDVLEAEIDRHRMAQSAKSLGPMAPEQVEQIVQGELDRDRQAQVRDLGSVLGLSQELKRVGRTWPTLEREQRIDKQYEIAKDLAIGRRLARQTNLFLTPRMLRETYEKNRDHFVRPGAAKVVQVRFAGASAKANADAGAELWRQETQLDARQLAAKFPDAAAIGEVVATSLSTDLAAVTEFALAGPEGAVSAPQPLGGAFLVAKVTAHVPARNGTFEDAGVQQEVRELCYRQVIREFELQAMDRARERTEVWRLQNTR